MSASTARAVAWRPPGRFSWLMSLYADNYVRLAGLLDPHALQPGVQHSSVGDGLDLRIELLERHAYTDELLISYELRDPVTGQRDPSAHVRVYHDARLVEATHCYVGRRWQDTLGLHPPPSVLLDHRLRLNTFIGKWLDYLVLRGHSRFTLAQHGANDDNARRTSA